MNARTIINIALTVFVFPITMLTADDGMWMPHQMKMLNLQEQGLQMPPDDIYKPDGTGLMSAVVDLGGGTASFVSDKGLLFTNHHVAYGALQRASDPEHNYLENGFLANDFGEEIQAPGYTAGVLLYYVEVTEKINHALKAGLSPREQYLAIDRIKKQLIEQIETRGPDIYAEIASMYAGNQYYLFVYKKIKDVRIVYAPPIDLGNFGGEVDNWMWPRHTSDFTFLRAYVSPEGVGVDYHPTNVPYTPKVHLKVAGQGVREDDFTFIMGYPGKTYRNDTTPEVMFDIEKLENSIAERLTLIAFFEQSSTKGKAVEIKYASMLKSLYNGLKNYRGKLEGFEKAAMIEKKKTLDTHFSSWVNRENNRRKNYGGIIQRIDHFLKDEYKDAYWKETRVERLSSSYGGALLTQAHHIVRSAIERQKPDIEREVDYQDRNRPNLVKTIKLAERRYDIEVDQAYTVLLLNNLLTATEGDPPPFLKKIMQTHATIAAWAEKAFRETQLNDTDYCLELLDKPVEELKKRNDPLINFAFDLEATLAQLRQKKQELDQQLQNLKKVYLQGLLVMRDDNFAPDANSTIRFTYGAVKGYYPRDGVYYQPVTTLKGVMEKDTGERPFDVPEKLKQLYRDNNLGRYADAELGSVPACFLNITTVTGGNSGSPCINAKGEVTGIVFDMTYESVIGDYYIIPEYQRVINVDMRYVLFITEKFSGATHLIQEMGLPTDRTDM